MPKPPLREYQQENVDWIKRSGRGLLADEPGLGKSRSALEGLEGAENVLIIAPSLIIETGVWHEEVEKWGFDDTTYRLAPYSQLNHRVDKRTQKQIDKGDAARYAPIKKLADTWRGFKHWDAVILDEAHYIKGRDTARTWAVGQISQRTDSLVMLTGTPIPNWAHEAFMLLRMVYPDQAHPGKQFGSFWRWAEKYFDCEPSAYGGTGSKVVGDLLGCTPKCMLRDPDSPCKHYRKFAAENFGDHYMRHLRAENLDLPPIEFMDVDTPFDDGVACRYRELRKDFATDIGEHEILAWSTGAKNVLMDKMTTSPWLLTKDGEPHGGKLEYLRRDLSNLDEPVLVLAHYRDSVEAATRVAQAAGRRAAYIHGGTTDLQNARTVRDFKAGNLDVLVGSLETLAEGLTLTVASTAIFLERSYKPSRNTQATFRIYRLGQDKACRIIRYLTPASIDTGKEALLAAKNDHQMRVLTAADFARAA
jgi:SNF2 family DNA or RNA helicase